MDGVIQAPARDEAAVSASPRPVPERPPAGPSPRLSWAAALAVAATAALSFVIPAARMDVRHADLTVPFIYGHDAFLIHSWMKTLTDTGWWMTTDRCGAPYGHEMYDFPTNPTLHFAVLRLMLPLTHDPAVLINAYYLLGFPLIGVTAHVALRSMRVAHVFCIPGGVLYACQPYHFWRGEAHLFLSAYFLLPLVTTVLVWLHRGEPLFVRRDENGRWRPNVWTPRSLAAALIVAAEGLDFPYFSVFAGFFLAVTGVTSFALQRQPVVVARTAVLLAVLGAAFGVSLAPNLVYFYRHGTNPSPTHMAHHPWSDGEEYALKPVQMLLPAPKHPIKAFERIRAKYYLGTKLPSEGDSMALGTVAALGFLALLACVPLCSRSRTERGGTLHLLGVLTVAGVLFGTAGGIGTVFNLLSLTVVRSYCRISIYLAFFSLAAFCMVLDSLFQLSRSRLVSCVGFAVAAAIVYFGCRDQMGETYLPPFAAIQEEYRSDEDFVARVEAAVPPGGMIFQYPYVAYSSYINTAADMLPYDHFRGYVHSRTTRWSFGAMHGRAGDDQHAKLAQLPTLEDQLRALAVLGFDGVYVDRFGYADRGAAVEAILKRLTTPDPIVSRNNRLSFFPLAGYRRSALAGLSDADVAKLRTDFESLPALRWEGQFYAEERGNVDNWRRWRWCGADGVVALTNTTRDRQRVRVRMTLRSYAPAERLNMKGPNFTETYDLTPVAGVPVDRVVDLPPGTTRLEFNSPGHAPGLPNRPPPLVFAVHEFTLELVN